VVQQQQKIIILSQKNQNEARQGTTKASGKRMLCVCETKHKIPEAQNEGKL
jgi:hypothetical protein